MYKNMARHSNAVRLAATLKLQIAKQLDAAQHPLSTQTVLDVLDRLPWDAIDVCQLCNTMAECVAWSTPRMLPHCETCSKPCPICPPHTRVLRIPNTEAACWLCKG